MERPVVISHERSGTHFLMNTIGENFGYDADDWIDFDCVGFHAYTANNVQVTFGNYMEAGGNQLIKSHHDVHFFKDSIIDLTNWGFRLFYIYRNQDDVMESFRKHIRALPWAGPAADTARSFAEMEPFGAVLRYQFYQYPTMKARHKAHVDGWLNLPDVIKRHVVYIRYEDLNKRFNDTVRYIGIVLGKPVKDPKRPSRTKNVILNGQRSYK